MKLSRPVLLCAALALALAASFFAGGPPHAQAQYNSCNYLAQGGQTWEVGCTLDIATGGKLTFNTVDKTAILAAAVANPVAGTAGSIKVASGSGALSSGSLAATTGLTTITACAANIDNSSTPGVGTSVVTEHSSGGTATFYGWKVTNSSTTTLIAATGTDTIDWVCFGT